jgi:4-hydroxythreonine-4-phosphate dehydrogenase
MTPKPLLITMGDPCGIGPEVVAKAFATGAADADNTGSEARGCVVVGDLGVMQRAVAAHAPGWQVVAVPQAGAAAPVAAKTVPVWPTQGVAPLPDLGHGKVSALAGAAAAAAITQAAQAALWGEAAGLVTAPIHKEALAATGVPHPGHTELLQALAAQHLGVAVADLPVRMMLANEELRTVLVSIHLSLREAIEAVTRERVLQTIVITHAALQHFGVARPRIAVAGLNPHAGEGGLFGREEIDHIAPAVADARAQGIDATGPHPPDTVFMQARGKGGTRRFDAVVAMYHDQGLIPVKYLGLEGGVNVTLGLPGPLEGGRRRAFVRTSPDHGTAFDIAGQGVADPSALIAAIQMARRLAQAPG